VCVCYQHLASAGDLERTLFDTRSVMYVVREADSQRRVRLERRCLEAAARHGYRAQFPQCPYARSDWREHIVGEVKSAVAEGARLVVAVGGDGTIGAAAEGVVETDAALAVVPCGAANLFARALGIPFGFEAALTAAFFGSDRSVDVAFANGRAVVTMAGIGLDAAVVAATTATSKNVLGWLGYGFATLPHLYDRPRRYEVRLDDGTALTVDAQTVVVANVGLLPAGLALSPWVRPDDGLLDVAVLAPRGPFGWAAVFWGMLQAGRRGVADRHLMLRQTCAVAISADRQLPRQLDGEPITPSNELAVQVAEGALTVRLPKK
jgi:diacylglycerol kinase family enzyme